MATSADLEQTRGVSNAALVHDVAIFAPKASKKYLQELKASLEKVGFVSHEGEALDDDEAVVYLIGGIKKERLWEFSDYHNLPARLNPQALRDACEKLNPPIQFGKRAEGGRTFAQVTSKMKLYPPFLHIYAPVEAGKESLFMKLSSLERHKMILRMMGGSMFPDVDGKRCPASGAGLNIRELDQCLPSASVQADENGEGPRIATLMVLHEDINVASSRRSTLYRDWIMGPMKTNLPWNAPVDLLRSYLGDQLGFYFLFTSTFATHCFPLGILGVIAAVAIGVTSPINDEYWYYWGYILSAYALISVLTMAYFLADFRRKQSTAEKEWGSFAWMGGRSMTRSDFKGVPQTDPADGHILVDFHASQRFRLQVLSWLISGSILLVAIAAVVGIFSLKVWSLDQPVGSFWHSYGGHVATVANILQVLVLNYLYNGLAIKLTRRENWKTDADYSDSLTLKLFIFQFINTFASLYYVAFIQKLTTGCVYEPCINEMAIAVAPLFISKAVASLATQLIVPWLMQKRLKSKSAGNYANKSETTPLGRVQNLAERQFVELIEYDNIDGAAQDYMEVAILFGYMACFGAAFPLTSIMCCCLCMIQLKQDAWKLLYVHRRPIPLTVHNIGVWETIFKNVLYIAIPTNVGLAIVVNKVLDDYSESVKLTSFFIGVIALYLAVKLIFALVPPISVAVGVQLKRQALYTKRVVHGFEADEVFDEVDPIHESKEDADLVRILTAEPKDHHQDADYLAIDPDVPAAKLPVVINPDDHVASV